MTLPTPANVAASAISGYLKFTCDRETDWRTTVKTGAGLSDDSMRLRLQWQVDADGSFTDPDTYFTYSVADTAAWNLHPEGSAPLSAPYDLDDPCELYLFGVAHNQARYARVRTVLLHASDGSVIDSSDWSSTVNATRNTALDPAWITQTNPGGGAQNPALIGNLDNCWLLLFHLVGGSDGTVASVPRAGIALSGASVDDSYWKGCRQNYFEPALTAAGSWAHRLGFYCRAAFGLNRIQTGASSVSESYNWPGSRRCELTRWDNTGGCGTPAMLNPLQVHEAARALTPGSEQTQLYSVASDLDELAGLGVPVVMYYSLCNAGNIHVDGGNDAATNTQLLNAHGLLHVLNSGCYVDLDVFFTVNPTDPELPAGNIPMEHRVGLALNEYGRPWYGERLSSTYNTIWPPIVESTLPTARDNLALSLLIDEPAYAAAKTLGVRVNLKDYLIEGETDPDDLPASVKTITMVTTNFATWVAAGADNEAKCARALDVAKDLLYTWRGRVLPAICSQAQWDEMNPADLSSYMAYANEVHADNARARALSRNPSLGVTSFRGYPL